MNILRKREDGYHDIETVMYPLKGILYDALEIIASPGLTLNPSPRGEGLKEKGVEFHASGIIIPGNIENNLCLKAYYLVKKDYPLPPIKIYLHKAIPIGAGLGGGSSDAAFFIRLLNETFELGISWGEMHHYARQLGSDCSFFISNMPAIAEGKGDELETIKEIPALKDKYIAVVYPDIHINTAEAYSGVRISNHSESTDNSPSIDSKIRRLSLSVQEPIEKWKGKIKNDFEEAIFPKYPELKKIKEKLYSLGAIYASMSGSGSALYGIFKKEPKTKKKFGKHKVWEACLP